ncbi:MAG: putative translation factor [Symbiobacteriaceae bacterium]|jgi:L-threonylcarbamoyladenylate synthase|nr:putative translation factor [Symbiobacteriaceae bacterium]
MTMENLVNGTRVFAVDVAQPEVAPLAEAAATIRSGGLVAFPTETVYGLGADAANAAAVERIFVAKGRPSDNPLIVHVSDRGMLSDVVREIPPKADRLAERFWPGPLTLVLPKRPTVPDSVTGGLDTVGVRMPHHPVALALIRAAGVPIAAPSANRSGRPSPTAADHVVEDLAGRIDIILDGGETGVGVESTVLDLTVDPPVLLRPGGVTLEQLTKEIGEVVVDRTVHGAEAGESPRSPGMKYKHYAPQAQVILVDGPVLDMQSKIKDLAYEYEEEGQKVGIMCSAESRGVYQAPVVLEYGSRDDLSGMASDLFSTLRAFDRHGVSVVLVEGVPATGMGLAIMNRLRRAAAGRVVQV